MPAAGAGRLADRSPPGFAGGSAPAIGPSGRLARRSPAGVVSVTAWSRSVSAARWSLRPAAESAAATSARAACGAVPAQPGVAGDGQHLRIGPPPEGVGRGPVQQRPPGRRRGGGRDASRTSSWANANPLPRSTSARCASPASRSSSRTGAGRPSTSASNPTSTSGPRTAAATSVGAAPAEGGQPLGHRGVTATGRASPFPGSPPSPSDSDSDSPGPAGTAGGRRCARGAQRPASSPTRRAAVARSSGPSIRVASGATGSTAPGRVVTTASRPRPRRPATRSQSPVDSSARWTSSTTSTTGRPAPRRPTTSTRPANSAARCASRVGLRRGSPRTRPAPAVARPAG